MKKGLLTKGYLTTDNAKILHELRFFENTAVHELFAPSIDELNIAIGIIELVIDSTYDVKHQSQILAKKRMNNAK